MGQGIIEEPQRSHLLQLHTELGSAADYFVLVGARAIRFTVERARPTKDFDFVLDAVMLRGMSPSIAEVLGKLHYEPVPEARNFQFIKQIPNTQEKMRIEFLGSEKEKRTKDFRVDVQEGVHARACMGAEIVLREFDNRQIKGVLPNGQPAEARVRVARPHVLLMMKLFAMDDRYRNIRGPRETEHDRAEARIHAADVASIVRYHIQNSDFKRLFWSQFGSEAELKERAISTISSYFADLNSPGILLYAEFMRMQGMDIDEAAELVRTVREVRLLIPSSIS